MFSQVRQAFAAVAPRQGFWSLRVVREAADQITVRQGVLQPIESSADWGAMVTIIDGGGLGYAATADLSEAGLRRAVETARVWAQRTATQSVVDYAALPEQHPRGEFATAVQEPWDSLSLAEKVNLLTAECQRLQIDDRIVDAFARLWRGHTESLLITSGGGDVRQTTDWIVPDLSCTAFADGESQTRSLGGRGITRQGGLEVLAEIGFCEAAPEIAEQAIELLGAPDCPTGVCDLLLAPDQMILQIHESIGHPLELDRILGDERNYAGRSFVTTDMLGSYQYGSSLLNVTFDPTVPGELASYAFDDDGTPATRTHLIKDGILLRPLGGATSQARAGLPGVANARACSWNRPPIDRMANLNLEPGTSTFDDMVTSVADGVYMEANCSWSIDDSRNKFQFGCERGRLIKDGELRGVVKNPNYRGISATFWRSLRMVGDRDTWQVLGTPFCGKGEPNQLVRVGHATPACLFADVEVFGGA